MKKVNKLNNVLKELPTYQNEVAKEVKNKTKHLGLNNLKLSIEPNSNVLCCIFSLKGMDIQKWELEKNVPHLIKFIENLNKENTINLIPEKTKLYNTIRSREDEINRFKELKEYSEDVVDLVLEFIKQDFSLKDIKESTDFISSLMDLNKSCLPSEMT